jgi:hypothetical protein
MIHPFGERKQICLLRSFHESLLNHAVRILPAKKKSKSF